MDTVSLDSTGLASCVPGPLCYRPRVGAPPPAVEASPYVVPRPFTAVTGPPLSRLTCQAQLSVMCIWPWCRAWPLVGTCLSRGEQQA